MERSKVLDAWRLVRSLATNQSFIIARDHVGSLHWALREILSRCSFDAIHSDQLWMGQYALAAKSLSKRPVKMILDQHNAVFLIPKRMASATKNPLKKAVLELESRKLAKYESTTCQQFDHVVWVIDEDRRALENWRANGRKHSSNLEANPISNNHAVIPICVDTDVKSVVQRKPDACRVTFLGGLHWPPNAYGILWFFHKVWPQVLSQVPEAILTVIGKDPCSELVRESSHVKNLDVTGYVDDPTPYLIETAVFIVPLMAGGGMRVKILDAWAWGLPVVSTSIGAEGIRYRTGEDILIADDADAFAGAVIDLLMDPEMTRRLGSDGRSTVERFYDWRKTYQAWDNIYAESEA
jgi:glycosyltransferase involved in cell wall biosynthesis